MKIAIFGIGGVGGIVGGALAKNHEDTFFYVRGEGLKAIKENGLLVESITLGNFIAKPKLASDQSNEFGRMDAIIVACKGCNIKQACEAISPMVGKNTVVITLLNGVLVSDIMKDLLPECILVDGTIRVFSHIESPGHIVHNGGSCSIQVGRKDRSKPKQLEEVCEILNNAGISTIITDNIELESWTKYATMGCSSVAFCYYDGPAGIVRKDKNYEMVLRKIVTDLLLVAEKKGVFISSDFVEKYIEDFKKFSDDTITSLYRDLSSGKSANDTELYHIIGRMIEFGREVGVEITNQKMEYERFA